MAAAWPAGREKCRIGERGNGRRLASNGKIRRKLASREGALLTGEVDRRLANKRRRRRLANRGEGGPQIGQRRVRMAANWPTEVPYWREGKAAAWPAREKRRRLASRKGDGPYWREGSAADWQAEGRGAGVVSVARRETAAGWPTKVIMAADWPARRRTAAYWPAEGRDGRKLASGAALASSTQSKMDV